MSTLAPFESRSMFASSAPLSFSNNVFPILDRPTEEDEKTGISSYSFFTSICGDAGTADGSFSRLGLRVGSSCAKGEL